jgi:Fic family protein
MQPPSGSSGPRVLQTRPIQDLINHLAQKHRRFTSLQLSPEQLQRIERWVEAQFVYSTLKLEGLDVTEPEVARIASELDVKVLTSSEYSDAVLRLVEGFRSLKGLLQRDGRAAVLSPELLRNLNGGATGFRAGSGDPNRTQKAIPAEHLPAIIENVCAWFTAESFAELNPIEQASIAYLRLVEIQPFDDGNERVAILAASLFTLRNELPPVIITPGLIKPNRSAVEESRRGNTQPMVELIAVGVGNTFDGMTELANT